MASPARSVAPTSRATPSFSAASLVRSAKPPDPALVPPASLQPADQTHWTTFWLTDRDLQVFTTLATLLLVLLVVRWGQLSGWGQHEIVIERLAQVDHVYRLDINEATWVEFAQLNGIGETLAVRIVEDREAHGPFGSIDELQRVKGIGPKTIERLKEYLRVSLPDAAP
jgi:competence protein ComEA